MSCSDFELRVTGDDGLPFFTVVHEGKTYVVANAGDNFRVEVSKRQPGKQFYRVCLSVDGTRVGVNKLMNGEQPAVFDAFLTKVGSKRGYHTADTWTRFKFDKPNTRIRQENEQCESSQDSTNIGSIKCTIRAVQRKGTKDAAKPVAVDLEEQAVSCAKGKKFFLAASLQTGGGGTVKRSTEWTRWRWHEVGLPLELEVKYETALTLLLRNILDKNNPEHREILARSDDPVARSLLKSPKPSSRPNHVEVIDLTKPQPKQLKVEGCYLDSRTQVAACDLTGSKQQWKALPKPIIEL